MWSALRAQSLAGWLWCCRVRAPDHQASRRCESGSHTVGSDDGHRTAVVIRSPSRKTLHEEHHGDVLRVLRVVRYCKLVVGGTRTVKATVPSIPYRGKRTRHTAQERIIGGVAGGRKASSVRTMQLGQERAGNHSAISRSADSTESDPCTRFCCQSRARSARIVPGTAFATGSVPPAI